MSTMKRASILLSAALVSAACTTSTTSTPDETEQAAPAPAEPVEQTSATPRLALSYDGGVLVLDADTLAVVADIPAEGFLRLNPAANGRHVLVSRSDGFEVLDLGTWTDRHGDHRHYYTAAPALTGVRFGGAKPGHVVAHDGLLTLFSDGTGAVEVVDPADLLDGDAQARTVTTRPPHHGVAVARADGTTVVSVGDEETRTGAVILDGTAAPVAATDDCPGLHGEAGAADGVLTLGCQDGVLIVRGNSIQKVAASDPYGRIGNQAGSVVSPVVLGDYKTDPEAELERPRRFTLTDTAAGTITVVPIDTSYSFRSLGRGPRGEAVILGTDGHLHVYDPASAQRTAHLPAIAAWTEPDDWQSPMPDLHIQDGIAYVSDPAGPRLVAVDLADGAVVAEAAVAHPGIELTGVGG